MKKRNKNIAIVIMMSLLLVTFMSGCKLIQKTPDAIAKQNVAKVGSEYITRAELDKQYNYYIERIKQQYGYDDAYLATESGKQVVVDVKKQVLDMMTEQKILEQKSKEYKLFKDESEIQSGIKDIIEKQIKAGQTEEEFKKMLEDAKITSEMLNYLMRDQVIGQKVYDYITKDEAVTDEEISNQYNSNKSLYTEQPNTMEVSHILVYTEQEAKDVKDKLDKGENFTTIALQYSKDPSVTTNNGNLGEIQYNDPNYDSAFMAGAMALKQGEVSQPVLSQFGYHIIKVTKKTEYPVLTLDKVKDQIKDALLAEKKDTKFSDSLTKWKEEAKIETYEKYINN